jgi:transcriptional regulator GlxA family with amidase domain
MSEVDQPHTKRTVGILIFDDVEVLDFCGPFEVFSSSSIEGEAPREERRLFTAFTIAEEQRTIVCRGGLLVQPNHTFADHPHVDIIVVPGGFGTRREVNNPNVLNWIASQSISASLTTSVCTGSFLLAAAGLLHGKRATSHWATLEDLKTQHPAINVQSEERVVNEGDVITSAGVSAGIDMALHVVEQLHGRQIAIDTARGMEYDWMG